MSQRDTTAAGMAAVADAAREALAGELFDVPAVLSAIEAASRQGRTWLRLVNKHRIEFDGAKAWRRLLRRLDELGYVARREWIMPLPGEDEELKHSELVIGWGALNTVGMVNPQMLLAARS
ncbi:MAG: hypothetical protein ABL901_05335 [Hyphomicrobiaceae bacterium]